MASIFFDCTGRNPTNQWRCYYLLPDGPGPRKRVYVTLGPHPRWKPGFARPRKPPYEIEKAFTAYREKEARAKENPKLGLSAALKEFLWAYEQKYADGYSANTRRCYASSVKIFLEWARVNSVATVEDVTVEVCQNFLRERTSAGKRNSVKTLRAQLSPAWTDAVMAQSVAANPWLLARTPGRKRDEHPPYWTVEEVQLVKAEADSRLAEAIEVCVHSGLRISALAGLSWGDVDFPGGVIRVRASESKSGRPYEAPLLQESRSVLEAMMARRVLKPETDEPVFTNPNTGGRLRQDTTYTKIKAAAEKAGVRLYGHYNHILRHSFATWAIARGVPLGVVQKWLGHASITETQRYMHIETSQSQHWGDHFSKAKQ